MDQQEWIAAGSEPASTEATAATETAPETTQAAAPPAAVADSAQAAGDAAKAAGATAAQAQQAAVEYIEAQHDGKPVQIPKGAKISWEQKGEKGESTIDEMRADFLRHRDWTKKTMALAEERRREQTERTEWDRQRVAKEAEWAAADRERKLFLDAQRDPAARDRLERHLEAMATDPEYARRWEQGLKADVHDAVDRFTAEQQQTSYIDDVIQDAVTYIEAQAAKHPGVDVDAVRQAYAQQWYMLDSIRDPDERRARERALTRPSAVDAIYQQEAKRIERYTAPLRGELDEMKKTLAALEAKGRTDQHNTETARAIARSKGNQVAVPAGAAPAPPGRKPSEPIAGGNRAARESLKDAWVAGG